MRYKITDFIKKTDYYAYYSPLTSYDIDAKFNYSLEGGYREFLAKLRVDRRISEQVLSTTDFELDTSTDSLNMLDLLYYVVTTADTAVYTISGSRNNSDWEEIETITLSEASDTYNTALLKNYNHYKIVKDSGDGVAEFYLGDSQVFTLITKTCMLNLAVSMNLLDADQWSLQRSQLESDISCFSRACVAIDADGDGNITTSDGSQTISSNRLRL